MGVHPDVVDVVVWASQKSRYLAEDSLSDDGIANGNNVIHISFVEHPKEDIGKGDVCIDSLTKRVGWVFFTIPLSYFLFHNFLNCGAVPYTWVNY